MCQSVHVCGVRCVLYCRSDNGQTFNMRILIGWLLEFYILASSEVIPGHTDIAVLVWKHTAICNIRVMFPARHRGYARW